MLFLAGTVEMALAFLALAQFDILFMQSLSGCGLLVQFCTCVQGDLALWHNGLV
jgi:hypothetical protein